MIIDRISQWEQNQGQYGEAVRRALAYISKVNVADMPSLLEMDGKRMFVMKQSPTTGTFEEKLAEIHAQHADIHLVVEGEEWQGVASATGNNRMVEDRLEESDYALFEHVENETRILLRPGDFSIFWPGEVHRPNCHPKGSVHLVKLVVKIHRDLF
ncbi:MULTISPECIES: YhcH/YjgK/YiaL family protein [unclassified Paenibacillus]|uniref:YhcH/YjgK/YiaL family protein n=1 Tax=unclassified Paenibacillus TaxID=185978 RepID=UPI002782558F|nr:MULTISPECIES: YhcH/YjgK/YiaL family protein [unclassified Paenibacillus]MDQ0898972.1 biofilm protein TabA [Paenibacillus sp. V4I7]MDQ0915042.1 biofilm protein TabA [Paenibacillus sp. V4I5]